MLFLTNNTNEWSRNDFRVKERRPKVPKSLILCFLLLSFFFGIDVGFTKCLNKRLRVVFKLWVFLMSIWIIVMLLLASNFSTHFGGKLWLGGVACQCLLNYLFLSLSTFTIYDFILKIYRVDQNVTEYLQQGFVGYATCIYTSIVFLIKLICNSVYSCYSGNDNIVEDTGALMDLVLFTIAQSPDLLSVIFVLVYYYIYKYITKLHELVMASQISLKDVQKYYIKLADCYDEIQGYYDRLLIVELTFETLKLMISVYWILKEIVDQMSFMITVVDIVNCIHIIIRFWMPAIMSEMVSYKVDAIKLTLHNQLLTCEDSDKKDKILRTLRYMNARELKHKIWRFIPIDLKLPINILKFTITYLIVIIQFSHLYG